jgi:methylmalonyl-CoA mutase
LATVEEAVTRLRASGAQLACLCGADEAYVAKAEAFAKAIKAVGVKRLALAGPPGDHEAIWRAAGVDDFIFVGADALGALDGFYRCVGA